MKAILLTCIVTISYVLEMTAQDSPSWAPIGAKWYYTFRHAPNRFQYLELESVGDTVIQDTVARVISPTIFRDTGEEDHSLDNILLHQNGQKIFYYLNGRFTLLYDFTLDVTDTLKIIAPIFDFEIDSVMHFVVDSVAEMDFNGSQLKRQYLRAIDVGASNYSVQFGGWNTELFGNMYYLIAWNQLECDNECAEGIKVL